MCGEPEGRRTEGHRDRQEETGRVTKEVIAGVTRICYNVMA